MMNLNDIQKAGDALSKATGLRAYTKIHSSYNGDRVIFYTNPVCDDVKYVYFCTTGRIEKQYPDTWRNPAHKEIIVEGTKNLPPREKTS